jgi:hypothetical protein
LQNYCKGLQLLRKKPFDDLRGSTQKKEQGHVGGEPSLLLRFLPFFFFGNLAALSR